MSMHEHARRRAAPTALAAGPAAVGALARRAAVAAQPAGRQWSGAPHEPTPERYGLAPAAAREEIRRADAGGMTRMSSRGHATPFGATPIDTTATDATPTDTSQPGVALLVEYVSVEPSAGTARTEEVTR